MWGLHELAWCTWCRLGGGRTQSSTWTFQQCTKHPQGPVWRCVCVGGQHGVWFLVVAGMSWGCEKSVVNLSGILPKPVLICHTCDSLTLHICIRPDAHTHDSSTLCIHIGPNVGLTMS